MALASFLRRCSKKVVQLNSGPFLRGEIKSWAPNFLQELPTDFASDHPRAPIIVLDCSTIDRTGEAGENLGKRQTIIIDHHSAGDSEGDIQFVNTSAPATSLLILDLIEAMGERPTKEEAELLFFAFATDTGYFRHLDEGTELSFQYVSRLVAAGASPKRVYGQLAGGKTFASRQHLGMLLHSMSSLADGKLIFVKESKADTDRFGRENRDSDAFYQQALGVDGVEAIAVLREDAPGRVTGGLRSKSWVDCGSIAEALGGGGHLRAAGFMFEGSLDAAEAKLLPLLSEALSRE